MGLSEAHTRHVLYWDTLRFVSVAARKLRPPGDSTGLSARGCRCDSSVPCFDAGSQPYFGFHVLWLMQSWRFLLRVCSLLTCRIIHRSKRLAIYTLSDFSPVNYIASSHQKLATMVIGSHLWLSSSVYDEGDELYGRATNFLKTTKWAALKTIASGFRGGIECQLSEKYSLGHFNLVRKFTFDDGECWVVRLRLPILQNVFGNREALDVEPGMRSEIATMNFLRYRTVPH